MNVVVRKSPFFRVFLAILLIGFLFPSVAGAAREDQAVYTLQADGLACPFCAYGIEKQLNRIDGVDTITTDIKSGLVIITMKAGESLAKDDASRAVKAAGFTMRDFKLKGTP